MTNPTLSDHLSIAGYLATVGLGLVAASFSVKQAGQDGLGLGMLGLFLLFYSFFYPFLNYLQGWKMNGPWQLPVIGGALLSVYTNRKWIAGPILLYCAIILILAIVIWLAAGYAQLHNFFSSIRW
jgi:hypothetical protein